MKNTVLILLICLAACSGQKENTVAESATALPSTSYVLDSLLTYDSEQALIERFGADNIRRDTAWLPEGMGQYMVTLLYPRTRNEVTFEWADSSSFSGLAAIEVSADSSEWGSHGVKIGTDMLTLVDLNGGDFTFSGFGWDYGGQASFAVEDGLGGMDLILESSEAMMSQEQQDSLMGDRLVYSKSTAARLNNPLVRVIRIARARD
jgi:hypothetical protein